MIVPLWIMKPLSGTTKNDIMNDVGGHPVIVDYFYHEEIRGTENTGKKIANFLFVRSTATFNRRRIRFSEDFHSHILP